MDADNGPLQTPHYLDTMVLVMPFQKPGLDGLALAFEILSRAKAVVGPSLMARLGLAYLGPAWLGPRPEAGPGTALHVLAPDVQPSTKY
jgi:hypothetical protein